MSVEDLENLIKNTEVEPPAIAETSSIKDLAGKREDVVAISAQRDMENRFNTQPQLPVYMNPPEEFDPTSPPVSDEGTYRGLNAKQAANDFSFALGYSSRVIRSVLAVSTATAQAERFGDVRKSQGFWAAFGELFTEDPSLERTLQVSQRTAELVKKIPALLTEPELPENDIPTVGRLITGPIPELSKAEWAFDLVGELMIEGQAVKAGGKLARKGFAKLTGTALDTSGDIVKKKGLFRLLGTLDDDEIKAMDDAIRFRRVGLLGTKPAQVDIDVAVRRTFDYIEQSKPSQLVKKEVISAKRKAAAAKMYDIQGDGYGKGYSSRLRKAGTATSTEKSFTPLLDVSPQAADDLVTLQKTIDNFDFGGSKIYTTANAQESLAKLYEYGELLTPGEVEGLRDIFGNAFADSLQKVTSVPTGIAGKLAEAGAKGFKTLNATSRTLMTTSELSFLLRQGNFRAWSRPKDAIRSFSRAFRSLISPKYADKVDDAIRFTRHAKIGTEHGLWLGKWRQGLKGKEEFFEAEWLDKVPIIGRIKRSFERGYVNGLNQIRSDWFEEGLQIIERTGRGGDDKLISKWATYVNNMTGRADLDAIKDSNKALKSMVQTAQQIAFAPRFAVSKWNRHKVAAEIMFGKETPRAMRRLLASDALVKWRRYERFAHYWKKQGGTVETDPLSSDFLKLKKGDTRHEVLGGDSRIMVLLARLVTGQTKDSATGIVKDNISTEIAQQYLAGKLNPMWSLIFDKFIAKRTFEGEDIDDPKVLAKVIRDKFIPLYLNDIKDKIFNEYEEQGKTVAESINATWPIAVHGFAGGGIQTYEPSARKKYELMIEDKAQELHAKSFDELPYYLKQEVLWEAENDDIDKTELLKEEMGMIRQTPGTAARTAKIKNKSFRAIRKELGKKYILFKESNVPIREFPIDIGDVRLDAESHSRLSKLYAAFIRLELRLNPEISDIPPLDYLRRRWLEDIENNARQDAIEEIIFSE